MLHGEFRLLIGLGNPGSKYQDTRHNIGFMVMNKLASENDIAFESNKKLFGQIGKKGIGEEATRLFMPNTYMNDSGVAIKAALNWFDLDVNQILVIVDDMDLPLGKIRLRQKGGAGGHRGLRSIINHIGTNQFCRVRIGIGSPSNNPLKRKIMTNSYVLGKFAEKEKVIIKQIIDEIIYGLEIIQKSGFTSGSNYLNSLKINELEL